MPIRSARGDISPRNEITAHRGKDFTEGNKTQDPPNTQNNAKG